jgi:hypothetical protein
MEITSKQQYEDALAEINHLHMYGANHSWEFDRIHELSTAIIAWDNKNQMLESDHAAYES